MRLKHALLFAFAILMGCNFPDLAIRTVVPTQPVDATPQLPIEPTLGESPPASPLPSLTVLPSPEATIQPVPTSEPTQPVPTSEPTATFTIPENPPPPEEAILILEPGPGSRVTSPVHIVGVSDPAFEQTLGVSIIRDDGQVMAYGPVHIEADAGQRGPFSVDVDFEIDGERQAFIQIFDSSPRDGGIVHLSSVGVTLASAGEAEIRKVDPHPERIDIYLPLPNQMIDTGFVHVEGFALASFEQTLLVELQDADGNVIAHQSVIVQAPDLGQPGRFLADLVYDIQSETPARLAVRDISPAFGGDIHVASVEITLAP
jgi:hypothetical protein